MLRLCLLLLMLTLTISAGYSTRADDDVWPITRRCFGEATPPPQGWTFSGTLLLTSPGRLHAFQQGWETPHIVVFSRFIPYSNIPFSGVLSPDGRWYAIITGSRYDSSVMNGVVTWDVETIDVFNTITGEKYSVPWKEWFGTVHRLYGHGLYWIDNQHLLYEKGESDGRWFVINPFTQEVELWNSSIDLMQETALLAPDATVVAYANGGDWAISRGEGAIQLPLWGGGTWRPDSEAFAAYTRTAIGQPADQLVTFDLSGSITSRLFAVPEDATPNNSLTKWSPDAQYLLFAANHLYIADIESQQIIDTCVLVQGMHSVIWSPTGTKFALITFERENGIQIFDLQTWGRYVVGYHNGDLIGWRADN